MAPVAPRSWYSEGPAHLCQAGRPPAVSVTAMMPKSTRIQTSAVTSTDATPNSPRFMPTVIGGWPTQSSAQPATWKAMLNLATPNAKSVNGRRSCSRGDAEGERLHDDGRRRPP